MTTTTASAILGQRKKRKEINGLSPLFYLGLPSQTHCVFDSFFPLPVLIGFIHAMQVCQQEGAASELGCRAGVGEDIVEGWKRMIEGEKEKENK